MISVNSPDSPIIDIEQNAVSAQSTCSPMHDTTSHMASVQVVTASESINWIKVGKIQLYESDREIIAQGEWLNDNIIQAYQHMLQQCTQNKVFGLQSTQLGKGYKFKPVPEGEHFVQVLHVRNCHWIVLSNMADECDSITYNVYDSANYPLDVDTKHQICSLTKPTSKQIRIQMVNIQRQPNINDCGLFALAVATDLVHYQDPQKHSYVISSMRPHLVKCIENGEVALFHRQRERRVPSVYKYNKVYLEAIYCVCRTINDKTKAMIKCSICDWWFHFICVGITDKTSSNLDEWMCPACASL